MITPVLLLIYVCILGVAFNLKGKQVSKERNRVFIIYSFFPIFLIQTLRAETVGLDTSAYVSGYYRINNVENCWESKNWEQGYVLLNRILGKLTNCNVQVLLGTLSAIILIGIGYFIYKNTEDGTVFWPVFFFITLNHYLTSMCSLRQYAAIAIGINIYTILKKKKSPKAYALSLILLITACMFHSTAFAFILIFLICMLKKVDKKIIVMSMIICIFPFMCFDLMLNIFFIVFPKYYAYFQMGHDKVAGISFGNTYILFLFLKLFVMGLVFTLDTSNNRNRELYILVFLSLIGAVISIMTIRIALVWRFGYYFDIFLILLIPKIVQRVKRGKFILYFMLILVGWSYYIYLLYTNGAGCVPYTFF